MDTFFLWITGMFDPHRGWPEKLQSIGLIGGIIAVILFFLFSDNRWEPAEWGMTEYSLLLIIVLLMISILVARFSRKRTLNEETIACLIDQMNPTGCTVVTLPNRINPLHLKQRNIPIMCKLRPYAKLSWVDYVSFKVLRRFAALGFKPIVLTCDLPFLQDVGDSISNTKTSQPTPTTEKSQSSDNEKPSEVSSADTLRRVVFSDVSDGLVPNAVQLLEKHVRAFVGRRAEVVRLSSAFENWSPSGLMFLEVTKNILGVLKAATSAHWHPRFFTNARKEVDHVCLSMLWSTLIRSQYLAHNSTVVLLQREGAKHLTSFLEDCGAYLLLFGELTLDGEDGKYGPSGQMVTIDPSSSRTARDGFSGVKDWISEKLRVGEPMKVVGFCLKLGLVGKTLEDAWVKTYQMGIADRWQILRSYYRTHADIIGVVPEVSPSDSSGLSDVEKALMLLAYEFDSIDMSIA